MMLLTALAACRMVVDQPCDAAGPHLLVAGVDPTFRSAGVSVVVPSSGCVSDVPALVGPDPLVRSVGEHVAIVDRAGPQRVQLFERGNYAAPVTEFAVEPRNANVHDVLRVDGTLLLTQYEGAGVALHDIDGAWLGSIDMSDLADSDGLPEPDALVHWDGQPHVLLQRLSRDGAQWTAPQDGWLVPLQLDSATTETPIPIGPNPRAARGAQAHMLGVVTGLFGQADGAALTLASSDPTPAVRALEADMGFDFASAVISDSHLVVIGVSLGWDPVESAALCVDLDTGVAARSPAVPGWWVDAVVGADEVYIAQRGFGTTSEGSAAILRLDAGTCTAEILNEDLILDPYSLDWVD